MTTDNYISLTKWILEKNKYFSNGYHSAYRDKGKILGKKGKDSVLLFPLDTKGNYFYLRIDGEISASENVNGRAMNCGPGRTMYEDTATVYLVAIAKNADPLALINNLRNTALTFTEMNVSPNSFQINREEVTKAEMAGSSKEDIDKALANLKTETIVRLRMNVTLNYTAKNCITDPCTC